MTSETQLSNKRTGMSKNSELPDQADTLDRTELGVSVDSAAFFENTAFHGKRQGKILACKRAGRAFSLGTTTMQVVRFGSMQIK